jgi:hypothetical protein
MHTVDAEIFAPGTWNKTWKFSAQDLRDIAATFEALGDNHHVPLKFGHNDSQPMTDGYPALGWVSKVWVNEQDKLMARFDSVPSIVKKAFDAKLYRHVSVELDVDVEHRGKKYKYVLSAVALLGADIPAVNTLNDLKHYLDGGERLAASRREVFSVVQGNLTTEPEEGNDMTKEELEAAIKAAVAPLEAKFTAATADLAVANAKLAALENEKTKNEELAAVGKVKMHREGLVAKLEAAVKDKRLTPAQRESTIKFMRLGDDKAVLEITPEQIDEYINVNGQKVKMSAEQGKGSGTGGSNDDESSYEDAGEEIYRRAKKLQGDDAKLSFSAARDRVMEADPELAKKYTRDEAA